MAKKNLKVKVDTINGLYKPEGTIKQLDSVFFNIEVTEEGEKKDLTGQTIKLFARKSDGKMVEQSSGISITNAEQGELTIDLLNAAVQTPGYVYFELEISDSNGIISTADFVYRVIPKVGSDEAIESTNEVSTLKKVEAYIAKAKVELEEFKKIQNEVLETNGNVNTQEALRVSAEIKREEAEIKREEAENSRGIRLKEIEENKYDNVELSGNSLKFYAKDMIKKSIILNVAGGEGNGGSSLNMRDPLPGEIFEIANAPLPPAATYGNIVLSKTSITIVEGQSDTFTVKLDKAPTNNQIVRLSKNNDDVTLNHNSLTFTSNNYNTPQTITVSVAEDEDYSNESCTITLSSPNVSNKTLEVTITDNDKAPSNIPVQSITLNHSSSNIKVDDTLQLTPIFNPPNATNRNVTWDSNHKEFATVSQSGLVTGIGEGSCTITCTTEDGSKTASCNITVESDLTIESDLNTSIKNGLTHMYDFTSLKENADTSNDLIGNSNITIPGGFNTNGCIAYKDTHLNAGELLERDFTVLGEIKYGSGYYTFYCGDKSLVVNNGSTKIKIGTLVKDLENLRLRPKQYYVICIKYDYNNKQMTLFVNGNLIHTLTHSDPINDNSIYISFASNTVEFGENYSLLVYNRQLTNEEVKTVSSEIKRKTINTDNILGISNKVGLKEFYDFNSITGEERIFNSLAGENALNVTGAISSNNGLVLGTGSQNLTSKYNIPFDTECTYFIKFTPPNSSIKGNKIIEFENVSLNISKTTAELKVGGLTTQSFEPVLNEKNIIAITINALSKEGKIYHNGLLKQTISNIEVSYIDGKMYMLANDLINHNIIMYDKVLNDSEIKAITRELEVI